MYPPCPVNPLKGPELSTLKIARTLVFRVFRPGMTQTILNSYICTWLDLTALMCRFVISIFQTTFSHKMTVVS